MCGIGLERGLEDLRFDVWEDLERDCLGFVYEFIFMFDYNGLGIINMI